MSEKRRYSVIDRARDIARTPDLDILEVRKYLGAPLSDDIRRWASDQPRLEQLYLDFSGVRAVTISVAEELGPLLMQAVSQNPFLEQRYPIFVLYNPEHAYTFAVAFANFSWTGLAVLETTLEPGSPILTVVDRKPKTVVVMGQLTAQMEQILSLARASADKDMWITSDDLGKLSFMTDVSAAARSKRLTELYNRRLLAFRENPRNPRERLFTPTWRL